ncbi:MAG: PepSY protein [Phenylobacterium sp.]|nr:PepSY protein [Phenylobacterium sp.]
MDNKGELQSALDAHDLRASMNWLHTWAGVVMGSVLFAIFWTGTLSVFDREIDRWMMPQTRLAHAPATSFDGLQAMADRLAPGADQWTATLPTDREPMIAFAVTDRARHIKLSRNVDPSTGRALDPPRTLGGTGFFFQFHRQLRLEFLQIGRWIVGLAGMTMLILCVSGVIFHKKIFADFFTLRIVSKPSRTALDLHVLAGVLGLPFNFLMPLSSLIVFWSIYMPTPHLIAYHGDNTAYVREVGGIFMRPAAGRPAPIASLDAMEREAVRRWGGAAPEMVGVSHPGDAAAVVVMRKSRASLVAVPIDVIYFDGPTGRVLLTNTATPIHRIQRFIAGAHTIQFRNWTLRWFYYASGLVGCGMVATGLLFWVQSRRKRHTKLGLRGAGFVEGLAVGSTTGVILATAAYLIANRLLPPGLAARQGLEVWSFYMVWIAALAHAGLRPRVAWTEQCWAIAAAGVLAVFLNAVTTGLPIPLAFARGQFAVAGVDCVMLAGAAIAAVAAVRLGRRPLPSPGPVGVEQHA